MPKELVLLGRWAETPLIAYPGYCDVAQAAFLEKAGFQLEPFTLLREGLHEQYYLKDSTEPLRTWFLQLAGDDQRSFIEEMYRDYYRDADTLQREFTQPLTRLNLVDRSDEDLARWVDRWIALPARLAGPIFFSVLLDIWLDGGDEISSSELVDISANARDHCSNIYDIQAKREAERVFTELGHRASQQWDDVQQLFPEELLKLARGDVAPLPHIAARRDFFVTRNIGGHYTILDGEAAGAALMEVDLHDLGEPQDNLSGSPAFGGQVAGRVTTILSNSDVGKFQDGDVLVAYQTSVWYEPLFERASAVLTELGGATSHAAVICAERKIPCIVGVRNLIRSVSDGDRVRVNATSGQIQVERS